jgi:multimeric flavodoxin WrbA
MKVIMINGSRREKGCTYTALSLMAGALEADGITSEIIHVGKAVLDGTLDDTVSKVAQAVKEADALVLGSPVYYASPSGEVIAFLDRLFAVASADFRLKPGAVVVSARRAGTTASLDVLAKYLEYAQMPIVSSNYWNMVHGNTPEDVMKDEEGIQIMETLGHNMAWLLKCIKAGSEAGVEKPEAVTKLKTNFIR